MTKRKNSKQSPSTPASPTNQTGPAPSAQASGLSFNTNGAKMSSTNPVKKECGLDTSKPSIDNNTQHPPIPPPLAPGSFIDPLMSKLQSVPSDLHEFVFQELNDKAIKKITKPELYRILFHFDPLTKSRPSHSKDALIAAYKRDVMPLVKPHIVVSPPKAPSGDDMDTDGPNDLDFDPLSSKTTCQMLRDAIEKKKPGVDIPKTACHEGLLHLYKAYIHTDLVVPTNSRWTRKPRVLKGDRVKRETVEDLCLALQVYAPHVFVHSVAMTHAIMISLYRFFVSEEPEKLSYILVEGFHYTIIAM
ncbi:hypothetical protein DFH28DRAFT_1086204 [Melampsora americana]|nr:hypothetical protein DFH28DRAFT_1086204 [Melampsora americana]